MSCFRIISMKIKYNRFFKFATVALIFILNATTFVSCFSEGKKLNQDFLSQKEKNEKIVEKIKGKSEKHDMITLSDFFTFDWDYVCLSVNRIQLERVTGKSFNYTSSSVDSNIANDLYSVDESAYKRMTFFQNDHVVYDFWYWEFDIYFGYYDFLIYLDDCSFKVDKGGDYPNFYFLKNGVAQEYN